MKRYEKMSKEEIIELLVNKQCNKCKVDEYCDPREGDCEAIMKNWLNEDIEVKPRWATIKSNDDIDKLWDKFLHTTYEVEFRDWLKEEIEV